MLNFDVPRKQASPTTAISRSRAPVSYSLVTLIGLALFISLLVVWVFDGPSAHASLYNVSFFIGPTVKSLLAGNGLLVCSQAMGTIGNTLCFRGARMPVATAVIAMGVRLFGDRYLQVAFFKTLVLLVPVLLAIERVWSQRPDSPWRKALIAMLLLLPCAMTPFLADVVNIQVEEGYCYSFLALAIALLFFPLDRTCTFRQALLNACLFGISIDLIYLAKSSMILAALALTIAFALQERRPALRLLVLLLAACAPVGWSLYQHHATGRYSFGTSLDGINLHKGNNEKFLSRYPPPAGVNLDQYDPELNAGHFFRDEWEFSDFHKQAAVAYLTSHPRETAVADLRKIRVLLFSLSKEGTGKSSHSLRVFQNTGIIMFRIILWAGLCVALYQSASMARSKNSGNAPWISAPTIFPIFVLACILPYILGFGYTRHASVLIYPAVLMCCAALATTRTHQPQ